MSERTQVVQSQVSGESEIHTAACCLTLPLSAHRPPPSAFRLALRFPHSFSLTNDSHTQLTVADRTIDQTDRRSVGVNGISGTWVG